MRSKVSQLLPGRRSRTNRAARRVLTVTALLLFGLVGFFSYRMYSSSLSPSSATEQIDLLGAKRQTTPPGEGETSAAATPAAGGDGGVAVTAGAGVASLSESLDDLVGLLRLYTAAHRIRVNRSLVEGNAAHNKTAEGMSDVPKELLLEGVSEMPFIGDDTDLLDDPAVIQAEQESYVERYIAPTQSGAALTPLRVLSAYYDPQNSRGLDHLAAAVEKRMNDDGYATHNRPSPTFYDASHAARRGYGAEGSVFVAIPFALSDITPDIVDAIAARATAPLAKSANRPPTTADAGAAAAEAADALHNPLDGADDAGAALDGDGYREIIRTAARCAVTVESVFRQAHRGISVTVGTIDVVVVSGVQSAADVHLAYPADVRRPITAEERVKAGSVPSRRYDRLTCEPPNFRSGWEDASYGFSWKDNLRQRRVLVPLTTLATTPAVKGAGAKATLSSSSPLALPHVGRYAALQLYRGESYVLFLRPGSVALPNWDLKLRLLYLRTPQRERAVLSSRPTPAVVPHALAAAVMKAWTQQPYLLFSSLTDGAAKNTGRSSTVAHGAGAQKDRAGVTNAPALDWTGRRLLQAFPDGVAAWLAEARGESALALWLVTPRWLWPTLVDALRAWRELSNGTATSTTPPTTPPQTPPMRDVFRESVLREVLGDFTAAAEHLNLTSVAVTAATTAAANEEADTAQLHGTGAVTATSQPVLTTSLTEAEVYQILILTPKRGPLPKEPITDTALFMTHNGGAASTTGEATAAGGTGTGVGAGLVACGTATTPLPYYSNEHGALVKRAFEYCWIMHHRAALRALAERLTHATDAAPILISASSKAAKNPAGGLAGKPIIAAAAAAATVMCGRNPASTVPWYDTALLVHNHTSRCLADMRYLDPSETPLLDETNKIAVGEEEERATVASWFASSQNAGQLRGSSAVPAHPPTLVDGETPAGGAAAAAAGTTTPYVLQSAASADLLFGPAEAFFDIAPEGRLRTRADARTAQLDERRGGGGGGTTLRYAETPEAAPLDPSLHYLDSGALDLYLTAALWTRGWNIFGITEAVVAGDDAPTAAPAVKTGNAGSAPMCGLTKGGNDEAEKLLSAAMKTAKSIGEEKLWALMEAHRTAGTPLGPASAPATPDTLPLSAARFPLRRTLRDYEKFANLTLAELQRK
ncbi:hypothetical protein ABB37_08900 [Leptomonas pyrrhocoris]|uniref:Uncharacterized protein n=1 Tax=Leptomonas pyrrhocoris TaxID=157538 RepID=A0A0M9FS44_LEPPY|nr:hypothetical protein ABB37_08900 [Leptomonas pyrrhocoris]KPA74903.1 hypothetical protein ABB37_08900 [Leptomonas pyrrhocoris]|eukprot:XP_015653342.1 hypothetical protein ABB37_08900 [Leptomonas pyrrhocoris]